MFVVSAYAASDDETHTETGVPQEGDHSGAFPPFDSATFPSQILWLAITFGLFYIFLKRVALPRLSDILEHRSDRIAQDLDQAARMKEEADEAIAAYEQELAEGRAKGGRDRPGCPRFGQGGSRCRAPQGRGRTRQEACGGGGAYRVHQGQCNERGRRHRRRYCRPRLWKASLAARLPKPRPQAPSRQFGVRSASWTQHRLPVSGLWSH